MTTYQPYLSAWRGGAALVVLTTHGMTIFRVGEPELLHHFGPAAVMAFIVLSGYLIRLSLERVDLRAFAASRMRRILPPFLLAILLTCLLAFLAPLAFPSGSAAFTAPTARETFSLDGLLPTLLFLNGFVGPTLSANGPLWSLSFEVWYYVLAICFASGRRGCLVLGAVAAAALTAANFYFLAYGLLWIAGYAAAAYRDRPVRLPSALLALATAGALVLLAATGRFGLVLLMCFGLWFAAHLHRLPPDKLGWRPLIHVGAYSYTLYATHFPILLFAYGASGEAAWAMLPALTVALLAAALLGPLVEGSFLRRRQFLREAQAAQHERFISAES